MLCALEKSALAHIYVLDDLPQDQFLTSFPIDRQDRGMSEEARPNFESLVERLENIVEQLESEELSLEDAIDAYREGVSLAREGHGRLTEAERKIEEVTREGDLRLVQAETLLDPEPS